VQDTSQAGETSLTGILCACTCLTTMVKTKDKRVRERISLHDVRGTVEIDDTLKPVTVLNASEEGVCIAGAAIETGTVVRLSIEDTLGLGAFSLYCRSAWSSSKKKPDKLTGLFLLNTNKVLFTKDLATFNRLIDTVRRQRNP